MESKEKVQKIVSKILEINDRYYFDFCESFLQKCDYVSGCAEWFYNFQLNENEIISIVDYLDYASKKIRFSGMV